MSEMKTMMVFVLDAGRSMRNKLNPDCQEETSKLSLALGIISTYMTQRIMASKTVQFSLVAYGVNKTDNFLNKTSKCDEYQNVQEVIEMCTPDISLLRLLLDIVPGDSSGDLIDGLVVGQDVLARASKGKYNRIIVLLTDGTTPIDDLDFLELSVAKMEERLTSFYALLVGKSPNPSSSYIISHENSKVLQSIAERTNGSILKDVTDIGQTIELLWTSPGFGTRPQQRKIIFELSTDCRVLCIQWGLVAQQSMPTLKKRYARQRQRERESHSLTTDRTVRNPEDPDEVLDYEEKVKGYKYGSQYIPMNPVDESAMKLPPSEPIIRLLGFMSSSQLVRHHFLDSAVVVQGESDDSIRMITSFSLSLWKLSQVALVRYVKSKDSDPKLAVLLPYSLSLCGHDSLLLHTLPCAEDMRDYLFPSLSHPLLAPSLSASQKSAVSDLVDSMTDTATQKLTTPNPAYLNILFEIQKGLIYSSRSSSLSHSLSLHASSPFEYKGESESTRRRIDRVKELFPLINEEREREKGKKRKAYWSDIYLQNIPTEEEREREKDVHEERKKEEAVSSLSSSLSLSLSPSLSLPTLRLSTVTPVEDFLSVLSAVREAESRSESISDGTDKETQTLTERERERERDVVSETMVTMTRIIELLVTNGGTKAHIRKAIECLKVLRKECVSYGEYVVFNQFMTDVVKAQFRMSSHRLFWELVVESGLSLISVGEDSASSVTPDTAKAFLFEETVKEPEHITQIVAEEEEDMFGDME